MKRTWLLFSQTVTILVAGYFVVATLQPQWLNKKTLLAGVSVLEAPASNVPRSAASSNAIGGFAAAAKKISKSAARRLPETIPA